MTFSSHFFYSGEPSPQFFLQPHFIQHSNAPEIRGNIVTITSSIFRFFCLAGIFIHVLHQQFTVWMLLLLHHHLMDRKCNLCASFGFFSIALCLGNKWTKRKAIKELDETVLRGAEKKQINNRNKANIIIIESHRYLTHIYNNTSYSMYS